MAELGSIYDRLNKAEVTIGQLEVKVDELTSDSARLEAAIKQGFDRVEIALSKTVQQLEFKPVKLLVFGAAGVILIAFFSALAGYFIGGGN